MSSVVRSIQLLTFFGLWVVFVWNGVCRSVAWFGVCHHALPENGLGNGLGVFGDGLGVYLD